MKTFVKQSVTALENGACVNGPGRCIVPSTPEIPALVMGLLFA
jgi:hypothetical protein